jgi:hypothetical protein
MDSEITLEDLPKVIENINKCMHVYIIDVHGSLPVVIY